ncbi:putative non-ribosomal peptide synthetase [Amycolatopsis mediterranei U32]|uniref:Putative non-ribosomal peptide synthetase n=1 Tax=Amycolatopsis mediterranei (strain U-32) TaxID=749927 RepID=A0A0H3D575_AMYMU|nr:non-ribosomal peptide synthetase [Amycolatopsis mediterranei]ADJ45811.1 putative non-ribosomal peptide synthetase [Amycolatopsis mediterranei U32]
MTAVDAFLPLSTAQTDVWYDEQLSGGGLAYAMADYLDITGPLDVEVFQSALRALADEAECFRARFVEVEGEPRQLIEPLTELPIRYPDVTGEADPESAALDWMQEDLRHPFSLEDFPLFRGALIKLGAQRHFWYLTTHHLIGDGFSAAICHRRLGELYNALLAGEDPGPTALPPFRLLLDADLAYQDSPHRLRDKAFWGRHFDTTPDLVSLSGKEPAPARGFLRRTMVLPPETAKAVREAAAGAKVTLPTFFIAAMAAYTQRLSGIKDLLLTVPVAARAGVRSRATPGMVANYLPLRMVVEPQMTIAALLGQASSELAATLKHQRYHVNQIRRDIGVRSDERRPFGGPFVNVLPPEPGLLLGDCHTRVMNLSTGITNDLSLTVLDVTEDIIEIHLNGNPDLYDAEGVAAHLERLAGFVGRLAEAGPSAVLGGVDVVSADELGELLASCVGAAGPVGADLVSRVCAIAQASPGAAAVADGGDWVSYGSLTGRASALSRRLPARGVVGVLADPGVGFVSAVLGVLWSGSAFVPLDAGMPVARLAGLLVDSGASCVVVGPGHEERAAEVVAAAGGGAGIVALDAAEDGPGALAPVFGAGEDAGAELAYVIFTSGSTGRPKGAMVHRRGMVNHLLAKVEDLDLEPADVVVQNAPVTFDVSVWQMLAPLLVGGRVRVVSRAIAADPDALFGLIRDEGVSVLEVVPSLLRAALDSWDLAGRSADVSGLRWLVVTGEALPPDLCVRWFERFPDVPLVNAYGPTECSDDVTHAVIRSGVEVVPIGHAVRNSRLYVLGDELRPVPAGAVGELFVGGLVVGRGYVGDPARTAAVFVADPFSGPGARMYRTGDRVRMRPDGQLEFVERRDFQVKIRGHRIELGEIESVLRAVPGVLDAVVRVLTDADGGKRLAGYLIGVDGEGPIDAGAVRSTAQQLLPDYMVPSALVVLDELPLTEHGKVDREALPAPDFRAEVVGRRPRNTVETVVCDILAEVLSVPRVYIDDNFFALGGDSISAIQVAGRARTAGIELTPRDILERRTPAAIAEQVGLREPGADAEAIAVTDGPLVELTDDELRELAPEGGRIEDVLPLSALQQGLLFHSEFDPDGVDVYTVQATADLAGPLDVEALRDACAALLRRYATLRAYFRHRRGGDAVQLIAAEVGLPWTEIDLSTLPEVEREERLGRLAAEDRERRFDLAHPPLVRFTLIKAAAGRYRFLWTAHHIATDGWSVPILIRELATLYTHGPAAALPEVTPFRNYLAWLGRQDEREARQAWREVLDGLTEPTKVAPELDGHLKAVPESAEVVLSRDETAELVAWARRHELTLNTVVQACWAILVGRLTGRRDVVFGSVTSGRPAELPGVETMVGMFINTVPVRADLDPAGTLDELLVFLRDQQARMSAYQHVGLAEVQNDVPGLAGTGELFDTAIVFENVPADGAQTDVVLGDDVRVLDAVTEDSRHYPLSLVVNPGGELAFRFDYAPEAFDAERVGRITGMFRHLLDTAIADPSVALGAIDVVPAEELQRGAGATGPVGADVVSRVRDFALATPEAPAVADGGAWVSYGSLAGRASALSRRLPSRGVVGVLADPGVGFVTTVLGVLWSGAAYLPLDPTLPVARLAGLLVDSGATAVVVGAGFEDLAAEIAGGDTGIVVLDEAEDEEWAPVSRDDAGLDLAYVIFTSGSTGRPKGAMVHRRGMVNHLLAKVEDLGLEPSDVVVQNAPVTFDVSVWQMLAPLLVGGRVRVVSRAIAADPDALFGLIRAEGVSVLEVVPSLLRAALDSWDLAGQPDVSGLRWLVVTGEALPPDLCARWFARFPDVPLVNAYGPTECSDDVTHAVIRSGVEVVPIGHAVRNSRLYVLGDELRPAPEGAVGELFVGGLVVGRGYVGDPVRTAAVFVADPFGEPGTRMYRTGDRVRLREDGQLEFVERRDFQVKIRGHRIELGEIEACLAAHAGVGEAVVTVHGTGNDRRLVAYVSGAVTAGELREHVTAQLPAYMVPGAYVVLDRFPLTAHGKIDRKALPAPEQHTGAGVSHPRTPVEATLCEIWADVLGVADVGIDDDFFAIGGHSLLANSVVSRVRSALAAELSIRDLFEARTVSRLAGRLVAAGQAGAGFWKLARPEKVPLSHAQTRMWFLNRLESAGYNIPLAVRLGGDLDPAALAAALGDVVERHEVLRTVFPDVDGVPYQRILPPAPDSPLATATVAEDELTATLSAAASRAFDLATDRPLRAALYRVADTDEHVLLLVLHHIAGDGWSVDVLARDLATAYDARVRGTEPGWADLPAQYADYAVWQRELLDDRQAADRQWEYWRTALDGLPDELRLPADLPRRAATAFRGGSVGFEVPPTVHKALIAVARRSGASVFMVVQAAVAALLTKHGAGTDIPLGSLVAGRSDEVTNDLVGFFVNTLVLRTDTGRNPTFAELVARVRDTDLEAYAHQDLPFELLLEMARPARSLSRQPLFQVMLSYYEVPDPRFTIGGLAVRPEILPATGAKFKFDLTFQLGERPGEAGMEGSIEYCADLFTPETAALLATRLNRLLSAVAEDPELPLSRIELVTPAEPDVLSVAGSGEPAELPVLRNSRGPALIWDGGRLSHAQLRRRVTAEARKLKARGAGPEWTVTIAADSAAERVVQVLAALEAGAAYRLAEPGDALGTVIEVGRPGGGPAAPAEVSRSQGGPAASGEAASPTHSAALLPDGTILSRRALAESIAALQESIPAHSRVIVPELPDAIPATLAALAAGGSVHLAEAETADATALARLLEGELPAVLFATPHQVRALAAHHEPALAGVRLIVAGEPLAAPLIDRLDRAGAEVHTHYRTFTGQAEPGTLPHPARAYVLDETLQPVPPGAHGELWLAGPALARGYAGEPGRTATRFVADPFETGERMYRTGDLVRRRLDGTLELVAEPIRARGFAIRPVEVEAGLLRHPGVAGAEVVVRGDQLVAYVIGGGDGLREHLARELPDFAVPSAIIELAALPLTAAGELDHTRLPAPETTARVAGSTPAEEVLRLAFAETLGLPEVDADADFFALGGNSLLSVRLVALARNAGVRFTVADVLTHGTVERLAALAGTGGDGGGDVLDPFAPVLPIRPDGDRAPLFCVHAGLGLSLPYLGLVQHLDPGRPMYGLQSPNIGGDGELPVSVEDVAEEYAARIRAIQPAGPYHLLGWSFGGLLAHEIAVQLQEAGERVETLCVLDSFPVEAAGQTPPTRHELLASFLEHLGHDADEGAELSPAAVIDVLRRGGSRLAGIGEDRMTRVLDVMSNNGELALRYEPARFSGRLLLFLAAEGLTEDDLAERPGRWAPFVDGAIEPHRIDCGHEFMMHPQAQAAIGRIVAAALDGSSEEDE